jgi:hypothetical protein
MESTEDTSFPVNVVLKVPRVDGVAREYVQFASMKSQARCVFAKTNIPAGTILYDEPVHYLLNERTPSTSDSNHARYTGDIPYGEVQKDELQVESEYADMQCRSSELTKFLALTVGVHAIVDLFQGTFSEQLQNELRMAKKQYKVTSSTINILNKLLAPYYIHLPGSFSFDEDIRHTVLQKSWVSLMDHSCSPNVLMGLYETEVPDMHSTHSKIEYRLRLITLKHIPSGHPIVRSYLTSTNPQLSPLLSRHILLRKQTWIQKCKCSLCAATHCSMEELSFLHNKRTLEATWIGGNVWTRLDANIPIRPYASEEKYPEDISSEQKENIDKLFVTIRNCTGTEKGVYLRRLTIIQWFLLYFTMYGKPALAHVHMEDANQLKTIHVEVSEMWTPDYVEQPVELLAALASFPVVYKNIASVNMDAVCIPNLLQQTCASTFSKPLGFKLWPRVVLRNFSNLLKLLIVHDWNDFSDVFVQNLENVTMLLITVLSKTMAGQREHIKEPVIACELVLMFALTQLRLKSGELKQRFQCIERKLAKERAIKQHPAAAAVQKETENNHTMHASSESCCTNEQVMADNNVDMTNANEQVLVESNANPHPKDASEQQNKNSVIVPDAALAESDKSATKTPHPTEEITKKKPSVLINVFIDDLFLEQYVQPVLVRLCITVDLMRFFYESLQIVHPSVESHLNSMFVRHTGDIISTQMNIEDQEQPGYLSAAAASANKSTGC